jgi:pseudouridine synthase
MAERLQKLMSMAGIGSRRDNELLIAAGRVTVNGKVARLGDKADPDRDLVAIDSVQIEIQAPLYIKVYKPKGIISSTEDELSRGRRTVRDLIELPGFLYPIGRLDKQSEGLMIMTNDGPLTHRLTHPRYGHNKVYLVDIQGDVSERNLQRWRKGVILDDKKTAPVQIEIIGVENNSTRIRITMREGRKRQIRRVAASFGYTVLRLKRISIGPIHLGTLQEGEWAYLRRDEVAALRSAAYGHKVKPIRR